MGLIQFFDIPEELDREFRVEVIRKFGSKKGSMSKAGKEVLLTWLEKQKILKNKGGL